MEPFRVRWTAWWIAVSVFMGLFTIGTLPFLGWLFFRSKRVKWIDEHGLATSSGKRFSWDDLSKVTHGTSVGGPVFVRVIGFEFGEPRNTVGLFYSFSANRKEAVALINEILARRGVQVIPAD